MPLYKMLRWVAVVLWMALIFSLSHQPASESSGMSSGITEMIAAAVEMVFPGIGADMDQFEHIVRKNAHFFIYFVLGVLVIHAIRKSGALSNRSIAAAIAVCALYAASDEFHQLFVPGRSGEFRDVLIDSSGAIAGIAMYLLAEKAAKRNTRKLFNAQEMQG